MRNNSHCLRNSQTVAGSEEHSTNSHSKMSRAQVFLHGRNERAGTKNGAAMVPRERWPTQRVRHFVRVFFQMRTWQDYASACFFSCLPRRRNNRDSKNNSRSPEYSNPRKREISRSFFSFFFRSLTIDSSKLRGKYSSIIDNNEQQRRNAKKNPFLVDRPDKGGPRPV